MIVAVIQTCDRCGVEGRARGMQIPDGWLMFDLRGGKEPGEQGYGWNVCSLDCMQATIADWQAGLNPLPFGMSEASQVIHDHSHADPAEAEIGRIAAASAEAHAVASDIRPMSDPYRTARRRRGLHR